VSGFTRLDRSSRSDWMEIFAAYNEHSQSSAPLRIMDHLRSLGELRLGFPCDQLHHVLMTATLARAAKSDQETVVTALCHDLGKIISVPNHAAIGAEILKPYVSDDHYQAVLHHQEFQGRYYYSHFGFPSDLRDAYRDASWYSIAERLVDDWDMMAFDPEFTIDPLESFEHEVVAVFSAPRMIG